jgi:hypothetical protein
VVFVVDKHGKPTAPLGKAGQDAGGELPGQTDYDVSLFCHRDADLDDENR